MSTNNPKSSLNKKSIAAIVDQMEARMRKTEAAEFASSTKADHDRPGKAVFLFGAASGIALALAAPLFGRQARPVLRGAIKGGIAAGRYVRNVASSVKEDMEDVTAEAKADLDSEQGNI